MKILLIGEYSGLHSTLAQGLASLGHNVVLASDGDGFKNYARDIDLSLKQENLAGKIKCLFSILQNVDKFKGFDVVQIINPNFTRIHRLNIHLFRYLKKHNRKVFLGAFGDDYYYVKMCLENKELRYSEFFVEGKPNNMKPNEDLKSAWLNTFREKANIEMAQTSDGIIACLYEYYVAYKPEYADKLTYIPLPVNLSEIKFVQQEIPEKVNFFIGINQIRRETKGSDILLDILEEVCLKYPTESSITKAESLTFDKYISLMEQSNIVVDQLYSYSPAMNGLLTLAKGKILVSGCEPEAYKILNEEKNKPIFNITPTKESVYNRLENIILNKTRIPELSKQSRLFVEKHHNHIEVSKEYLKFWLR